MKILLPLAQKILMSLFEDKSVKLFIIQILEKYAATTGNDVDDMVVSLVRGKLLK